MYRKPKWRERCPLKNGRPNANLVIGATGPINIYGSEPSEQGKVSVPGQGETAAAVGEHGFFRPTVSPRTVVVIIIIVIDNAVARVPLNLNYKRRLTGRTDPQTVYRFRFSPPFRR